MWGGKTEQVVKVGVGKAGGGRGGGVESALRLGRRKRVSQWGASAANSLPYIKAAPLTSQSPAPSPPPSSSFTPWPCPTKKRHPLGLAAPAPQPYSAYPLHPRPAHAHAQTPPQPLHLHMRRLWSLWRVPRGRPPQPGHPEHKSRRWNSNRPAPPAARRGRVGKGVSRLMPTAALREGGRGDCRPIATRSA